ncbi:MAG: ATP-binding protein [Hydrogenibacillus schlegelii]|uniref:ATP-binding protein n=1 Tax=Hydrogenibacillus schlegelii TaxID=1484 RepID=A0A947D0A1_HYDSH|nr:ATP-binding protein [Hydrogenibacillus schlegelii]
MFEPIKAALRRAAPDGLLDRSKGTELEGRLLSDPRVRELLDALGVAPEAALRSAPALLRYLEEAASCAGCPGLSACTHAFRGHVPVPRRGEDGGLIFAYEPCAFERQAREAARRRRLFRTLSIPEELRAVRMGDLVRDEHNARAIAAAEAFLARQIRRSGRPEAGARGLYVYGPFGVGKSYLMAAVAGTLVDAGVSVFFAYVPALVSELRAGVGDETFLDQLRELMTVDVFILDDLGAEQVTPWVRDAVLLPVLSTRAEGGRPTLFTSNLPPEDLLELYGGASRDGVIDELRAHRLVERIRTRSEVVFMGGPNRRLCPPAAGPRAR